MTAFEYLMSGLTTIYVIITGYYAYVSRKTLNAINKQAELTEKQSKSSAAQFTEQLSAMSAARNQTDDLIKQAAAQVEALTLTAKAGKDSADLARQQLEANTSKERARIKINVQGIVPQSEQSPGQAVNNLVVFWLANYGATMALIDDFRVRFVNADSEELSVGDYGQCRQVMYAESLQQDARTDQFFVPLEPNAILSTDEVLKIRKGESFLHFYGFVKFRDVFQGKWMTTIHMRWIMRWGLVLQGTVTDWWEPVGPPEDNQEKREQ
jgi:hypothetical protein